MGKFKKSALKISSSLLLPRLFSPSPRKALTTILYHRFFEPGESMESGRTRLKFQLEWLRKNYTILSPDEAVSHLGHSTLPSFPLMVTSDDARTDLLSIHDIFLEFEIPLTVFVCSGWVDNNEPTDTATLSRIMDFVRWYEGEPKSIDLGKYGALKLVEKSLDTPIDWLILKAGEHGEEFVTYVWDVFCQHRNNSGTRKICTWGELADLHSQGVIIGSHTVTHCRLAQSSPMRLACELSESKRTIETYFPTCNLFAYPFGTADVVSDATTAALKQAGYTSGFLSHANFSRNNSDLYTLPRIVMPDTAITLNEFEARALGATIPFNAVKQALKGQHRS